jgi:hypothetical protein
VTDLLNLALTLHQQGYTPLPINPNATKMPAVKWATYLDTQPTTDDITHWFTRIDTDGIGIITGASSGNLEMIEFEGRAVDEGLLTQLITSMADHDAADLWHRIANGWVEITPGGGYHWHYRISDGPARPNTKLARRPATPTELQTAPKEKVKVLIETRGQGGFTVIAPSAGRTHLTGNAWVTVAGGPPTIPSITSEERDLLYAVANLLDRTPTVEPPPPRTTTGSTPGTRPGDDYNQRASWDDILTDWTRINRAGFTAWRRPGKTDPGISATTGRNTGDNLYVFSSSTEFDTETPYSKFAAYALLHHAGDYSAAAKALAAQGYGDQRPPERQLSLIVGNAAPTQVGNTAPGTPTPLSAFDQAVADEALKLRIREAAKKLIAAETAANLQLPTITDLATFLAIPDEEEAFLIDRLWPVGGRVVLSAQRKAGKSTLGGGVIRSLVDGEPFLGEFKTEPINRIVLIDNELDPRTLRRWLRRQGVEHPERVELVSLRGQVSTFDILDDKTRTRWAELIGPADVLMLDCLRPVLDALGLDEARDAGQVLTAFDALLYEAGIAQGMVTHHMGHNGERARGDSRLRDWPDVEWKIVREKSEDETEDVNAARYFSAEGRDVKVPESLLEFNPLTGALRIAGGSRGDVKVDGALQAVLGWLERQTEGVSGNAIEVALSGSEHSQKSIRDAIKRGIAVVDILAEKGPRNATLHSINPSSSSVRRTSLPVRQRTVEAVRQRDPLGSATSSLVTTENRPPATTQPTRCAAGCGAVVQAARGQTETPLCRDCDPTVPDRLKTGHHQTEVS